MPHPLRVNVGADELRAILQAYRQVADASWPDLHPDMRARAAAWPKASADELKKELAGYIRDSSDPRRVVRVFYKLGPAFVFGGCNAHFANDAGLTAADIVGLDDFSTKLPWAAQAAKYRADDKEVFDSGAAKLDILERQTSSSGTVTWVHVGKAPIRTAAGVIGIFGMYEVLDDKTAQRLYRERSRSSPS
jgi:hypothetical protein